MKTLVIYSGEKAPDLAHTLPKGTEITSVDIQTYKTYLKNDLEKKDVIIAFHSMQKCEATEVPAVVMKMAKDLAIKGELWVYVPSFEWATAQTADNQPSPAFHSMLFGSQEDPHRCTFTILWLRSLLEAAGLVIRTARHEPLMLKNGNTEIPAMMNIVIGWKFEETETAEDSIQ